MEGSGRILLHLLILEEARAQYLSVELRAELLPLALGLPRTMV